MTFFANFFHEILFLSNEKSAKNDYELIFDTKKLVSNL